MGAAGLLGLSICDHNGIALFDAPENHVADDGSGLIRAGGAGDDTIPME
jgi:hypothetical protein